MMGRKELRRDQLLSELRRQSVALTGKRYSMKDDGILIDLAYAASYAKRGHVFFRGVRFPLHRGWFVTVMDPETFKPLISVPGGILL